jgi:hypothetical protein
MVGAMYVMEVIRVDISNKLRMHLTSTLSPNPPASTAPRLGCVAWSLLYRVCSLTRGALQVNGNFLAGLIMKIARSKPEVQEARALY